MSMENNSVWASSSATKLNIDNSSINPSTSNINRSFDRSSRKLEILERKRPPGPPPIKQLFLPSRTNDSNKLEPKMPPPKSALRRISSLRQSNDCPSIFQPEMKKIHLSKDKESEVKSCSEVQNREPSKKMQAPNKSIHKETIKGTSVPSHVDFMEKSIKGRYSSFSKGRKPPPGRPPPDMTKIDMSIHNDERQFLQKIEAIGAIPTDIKRDLHDKLEQTQFFSPIKNSAKTFDALPKQEAFLHANSSDKEYKQVGVKPGSLWIRCIDASNIRLKSQVESQTSLNPFLMFSLGYKLRDASDESRSITEAKSQILQEQGQDFSFEEEIVKLNVMNQLILPRDVESIDLKIQLFNHSKWGNDILGEVVISAARFFTSNGTKFDEWIPLLQPGDNTSNSSLHIEVTFLEVKIGMVLFTLYECSNLMKGNEVVSNPYVTVAVGDKMKKRSRTIFDAGSNPYFGEETMLLWINESNWFDKLEINVWNENIGNHDHVGLTDTSLLAMMNKSTEFNSTLPLAHPHPQQIHKNLFRSPGKIRAKIQFLPAGELSIHVMKGKYLREIGTPNQMDPFVILKADGNCMSVENKTIPAKDGGSNPTWDQHLKLPIVDQYTLTIECYDHDALTDTTTLIGSSLVSLLPAFKNGSFDLCAQLQFTNEFGRDLDSGQVTLFLDFQGPRGVSYPQNQPTVISYDDTHRQNLPIQKNSEKLLAQDIVKKSKVDKGEIIECGYTNDEMKDAFIFLDLDKNGYLGASEIRHVLICMGEKVTDEEIDVMISMLDVNGDGQVSLDEFKSMVRNPDPAALHPDLGTKNNTLHLDVDSNENMKEIEKRNIKRNLLAEFVCRYNLNSDDIMQAWEKFKDDYNQNDKSDEINYDFFCTSLPIERSGETKAVFKLFDNIGYGKIDVKNLLLSLMNFVPTLTLLKRCEIIFCILNNNRSDFMSLSGLEEALMGNHMMSKRMIRKKAKTIMKHADLNSSGFLCLDEMILAGSKFPTLLFPTHIKFTAKSTLN